MKAKTSLAAPFLAFAFVLSLALLNSIILFAQTPGASKRQEAEKPIQQQVSARITHYMVQPEFRDSFKTALHAYVHYSLSDKHNIMSEAYTEEAKPNSLWLIERWDQYQSMEQAGNSKSAIVIQALAESSLEQPASYNEVEDLEPLSKAQWRRTAAKADSPLTIMLFVDAREGTTQRFMDTYHTAMPQFRSEPGVITYQLSRLQSDAAQFVTYEKFRSNDAFQYHLDFPPIQPVIDYLNTSIKKQPFQDGLHRLIEFAPLLREK